MCHNKNTKVPYTTGQLIINLDLMLSIFTDQCF